MRHLIPEPGDVNGPGTPGGRFVALLNALDERFPDPEPFSAMAPEGRYMKAIDALIAGKTDKLVHQVTLPKWDEVARVMREYKKKKHAGFYLHVEELFEGSFRVQVFKRAAL